VTDVVAPSKYQPTRRLFAFVQEFLSSDAEIISASFRTSHREALARWRPSLVLDLTIVRGGSVVTYAGYSICRAFFFADAQIVSKTLTRELSCGLSLGLKVKSYWRAQGSLNADL